MTEKEAIKRIKTFGLYHAIGDLPNSALTVEAFNMAISALEKQIPKKPFYEGDGYADGKIVYDTWICPCCDTRYEVDYDEYDYCPECGQGIDWSDI